MSLSAGPLSKDQHQSEAAMDMGISGDYRPRSGRTVSGTYGDDCANTKGSCELGSADQEVGRNGFQKSE